MARQDKGPKKATGNKGTKEVTTVKKTAAEVYEEFKAAAQDELQLTCTFRRTRGPNTVFATIETDMIFMQLRINKRKTATDYSDPFIHFPEEEDKEGKVWKRAGFKREFGDIAREKIRIELMKWDKANPWTSPATEEVSADDPSEDIDIP